MELVQKSNAQIETLKAKYLTVLKQMRDDLVRSKKASWTRLEEEWRKRKVAYDQAWMERCQGIHRHIQKDHSECPTCLQSQGSPLF